MPYIPVDTAVQLIVGPLIDDTDFKSLETGVAYNAAGMSVDLIKSSISGTPTKTDLTLTTAGSQDWIELGNGMYYIEITAAQNNVEGELQLVGVATGICPFISAKYQVVPVAVFNSLVAGSDNLQVDAIQISGDATAADNAELFFDGTGYAAANSTIGTVTTLTGHTAQTGDSFARIGATGSGLTSLASQTSVNTVDSNVDAILLDTGTDGVLLAGTATSAQLVDDVWDEAIAGHLGAGSTGEALNQSSGFPTTSQIADAVWDEATSGHITAGTYGVAITDILADTNELQTDDYPTTLATLATSAALATVDANVDLILEDTGTSLPGTLANIPQSGGSTTWNATALASINAEADTALTDYDAPTKAEMDTAFTEIKGATWSSATDTLEQLRDRGDAAWTTGAGGSDRLLMVDTTIATLATQISFTLTAGSTDDDAYNGCTIVIEDVSTSTQKAIGIVDDYTGSTKTVTLLQDPGVFTMAATDKVYILAEKGLKPTTAGNYHIDVSTGGNVGIDWANVESPTTAVDLSGTDIQLCDTVTTNTDMRGTDSAATAASLATAQADLDIITGADGVNLLAATQASIDAIEADTNELQADDYPTTLATLATTAELNKVPKSDGTTSWNATALAAINAEADTAIADASLATAASITALDAVVDTVKAETVLILSDTNAILVDTAEIGAAGIGLTAVALADATSDAVLADAIWNAATVTYGTAGTYGEHVETLSAGGDATEAKQDQLIAACITNAAGVDIAADIIAVKAETALIVADTNELQTDWANDGRLDNLLDGAASAGDPWTTTIPGAYGVGTAGYIVGTFLDAAVSTVDTVVDAIKAKTDLIGSVAATTSSASETKSLTVAVGSTESVSIVCNATVDALTLAVSVQTKSGTVVATVADGSITKSGTTASFALTSDMTASERILRVLITNTATSAQVASPILSVEYDT